MDGPEFPDRSHTEVKTTEHLLRRSDRIRSTPKYLKDFEVRIHTALYTPPSSPTSSKSSGMVHSIQQYLSYSGASNRYLAYVSALDSDVEPTSYQDAAINPRWREAMAEEIKALEANGTWTIERLPPGKRPIDCRWVYKIKRRANGSIERYKARLVAKGFTQIEGVDFHETFAPVAKLVTVRCLLAVAVAKGWEIHQMDVNNAFLHGDLDEEVYMHLPPGYSSSRQGIVCRLQKSLYGLRQAPRNWYAKLAESMSHYGFRQSGADHSLFVFNRGDIFLAALVYVDDILVVGNNHEQCTCFKRYLDRCFRIKDLEPVRYFLGIEVFHSGPVGEATCHIINLMATWTKLTSFSPCRQLGEGQ
ncbi:hypothetical protein CRG98_028581 [Punica granatum]|uniref:Reverse transcriptase Ty1/copia-type domain-containing protein n=1 Tax=Punica granatum TaxID=22663 RepID=A0A2I0J476_PUNGR|nr:hypothetical protein CRG98_028581 [Punica granatum]